MFAAIFIPDFPVEAIVRLKAELRERAVAVMEGMAPLLRVVAVNACAADAGLETGMTKLQAEEHAAACNGVLAMRSLEQEASAQAALLDAACGFSPRVEDTAPGIVVIDLHGLERIFGPVSKMARDIARRSSEIGLEAQVAVAANPDAAIHAARGFSGVTVIPEGREAERLATLTVDVLTVIPLPEIKNQKSKKIKNENAPDLLNTLESWGVRNLRALAALPEVAVTERLGQAGLLWQRMARGATRRALKLIEPPARFEETCELEYPVESLEPLSFLLNRMLDQLCARLSSRALATNELTTTLTLEVSEDRDIGSSDHRVIKTKVDALTRSPDERMIRSLRLPVPMLDAKVFLKLLQLDLQSHPPGAPVVKIAIEATPAEPRRTQNGLFQPSAPEPERLEVTLARIGAMIDRGGEPEKNCRSPIDDCRLEKQSEEIRESTSDNQQCVSQMRVGVAEILDTHRPDGFRMNRFIAAGAANQKSKIENQKCISALRLFRPALKANVTVRAGKPVRVECEAATGEIDWAAGPWKSSGEWWSDRPWAREEWDVCVGEACYRVFRDGKGWYVEGSYD